MGNLRHDRSNSNGATNKPRRVAFYGRVSSDEQRQNQTIQTQLAPFAAWMDYQAAIDPSITHVGDFLDDGVSGTIPFRTAPLVGVLWPLLNGEINCVVVYKFDRLGRDEWGPSSLMQSMS
jgi:DNA invertase Pin-like site-specific DNA recombinase